MTRTSKVKEAPAAPVPAVDPVVAAEEVAVKLLRAGYRREVEALAFALRPRLLAGEFSGEFPVGEFGELGFDRLRAVCRRHRLASTVERARLTIAFASPRAAAALDTLAAEVEVTPQASAALVLAVDVLEEACRFGLPRDDTWDCVEKRA